MLPSNIPQQASVATRFKVWYGAIPLHTRCTLVLCCSVYAACLLSGFDTFHSLSLDATALVERLQLWRLCTAPLLHVSILHLAFNMMAFVPIASSLERVNGTVKVAYIIALLALCGSAVFVAFSYLLGKWYSSSWLHSSAVGYSGIIFGLVVIDNVASGVSHRSIFGLFSVPARLYAWVLLVLWQILLPGVSFLGHLGGIVAGEALSRGWMDRAMLSASLVQRIESAWPVSLMAGMDAFILSCGQPAAVGPWLPTSSRASVSGTGAAEGAHRPAFGLTRLSAWLSRGWTRVPNDDSAEQQWARGELSPSGASQANFAGQAQTTGQTPKSSEHPPGTENAAQAAAAAAQERARGQGNTRPTL